MPAGKEPKGVNYPLEYRPNLSVSVVEAKDNRHQPGDGMQQAIEYAEQLEVPAAFTTKGDSFVWHDRTGICPSVEEVVPQESIVLGGGCDSDDGNAGAEVAPERFVADYPFPLAPLEEQRQIVELVRTLMALRKLQDYAAA